MSETDRVKTLFSEVAEAPELEDYRPISPLVIGACLAALASLLAMVHPLLWIVPVLAVILAVCAIVRVSSAQSRHGGRNAAVVALCLAVLNGSYAPARTISRDRMLYAEAKKKTDAWLSLVQQGRVQEAFQLSQSSTDRFQGPGSLASHYAEAPPTKSRSHSTDEMEGLAGMQPSPAEQLKEFVSSPLVAKLLEFDEQARFEHLRNVGMRSEAGNLKITQRYRVSGVCSGQPDSMDFLVVASRYESRKLASWSVGDIRPVE